MIGKMSKLTVNNSEINLTWLVNHVCYCLILADVLACIIATAVVSAHGKATADLNPLIADFTEEFLQISTIFILF